MNFLIYLVDVLDKMKILINYDFINAIKNVNENYSPFKVIRNNKAQWVKFNLPMLAAIEYIAFREEFFKYFPSAVFIHAFLLSGIDLVEYAIIGDKYKMISKIDLINLISKLKSLNVFTSYELLKKTECYNHITNFRLNENKIPQLIDSKYALVPSYNTNGEIIDTSILQEHIIGSNEYELSIGVPKKVLKPVYYKI